MDEKLKFVSRYLDGEKIATLCQEFGISRVTGHKIIDRYKDSGLEAGTDPLILGGTGRNRTTETRIFKYLPTDRFLFDFKGLSHKSRLI